MKRLYYPYVYLFFGCYYLGKGVKYVDLKVTTLHEGLELRLASRKDNLLDFPNCHINRTLSLDLRFEIK